jgi:hypothetical protein
MRMIAASNAREATILQLRGVRSPAKWSAVRADTTVHRTPRMYENPTERDRAEANEVDRRRGNDKRHTG